MCQVTARAKRWRVLVADVPMQPLRAPRATIVTAPALVDQKTVAGLKEDAGRKTDVALKVGVVRKTGVVLKADADQKADADRKTVAVRKADAVQTVVAVPDDVRSRAWSSLSVPQFPAAGLTRRGSHLQAFQFGRLRRQSPDHVAVRVAKDPMVPVAPAEDLVVPAVVRLRAVIANRASCATRAVRGRQTSKFFTSSACFSM